MKKALSLVLALVMVLSCVSGFAFAARPVAASENATWLAVENNSQQATYVTTLDTNAAEWAAGISGGVTFYLLKDASQAVEAVFPATWAAANPVTLDLNGHTLTSTQNTQDFTVNGNGVLTIQNGVYKRNGTNPMIRLGSNATDATKSGTSTDVATLNIKNAFVYHSSTAASYLDVVIYSLYNKPVLNVDNSVVWSCMNAHGGVMRAEQLVLLTANINNSIFGNSGATTSCVFAQGAPTTPPADYVMNAVITATNSALATSDGTLSRMGWRVKVNAFQWGKDQDPADLTEAGGTVQDSFSFTAPGNIALNANKAQIFGTAPTTFTVAKSYGFVLSATGKLTNKIEATDGKFTAPAGNWNTRLDGSGTAYAEGDLVPASAILVPYVAATVNNPTASFGAIMAVNDAGDVYYFPTLSTEAVTWAANQEGGATLYLLKDMELADQVVFPATWSAQNPVILDLNGNTLTSNLNKAAIVFNGNGILTLQNGYFVQTGASPNFSIGTGAAGKFDALGLSYEATLNFKNAVVCNTNTAGTSSTVIYGYYKKINMNVDNSIVWATQNTWSGAVYTEYSEKFILESSNSVIGCADNEQIFVLRDKDLTTWSPAEIKFTVSNTVFANTTGKLFRDQNVTILNGTTIAKADSLGVPLNGATLHDGAWSITAPNGDVLTAATAQVFGTAPTAITVNSYVILMDADGKIESFNSIPAGGFELPATGVDGVNWNTSPDGTGVVYKAGDILTAGTVLYRVESSFVFVLDADYHMCSTACSICGGCLDADCDKAACADKCMLATLKFDDLKVGHWYKDAVEYVYHAGIMDSASKTSFGADKVATRATVVTSLWRMAGKPKTFNSIVFSDVASSASYAEAVRWAAAHGITTGDGDGNFNPNGEVTREQLATFLYRFAKCMNLNTTVFAELDAFSDANTVSEYAVDAMKWAVGAGVINGKGNGTLDPTGDATHAELAKMLMVVSNL